jgi:hypothetical protein
MAKIRLSPRIEPGEGKGKKAAGPPGQGLHASVTRSEYTYLVHFPKQPHVPVGSLKTLSF